MSTASSTWGERTLADLFVVGGIDGVLIARLARAWIDESGSYPVRQGDD